MTKPCIACRQPLQGIVVVTNTSTLHPSKFHPAVWKFRSNTFTLDRSSDGHEPAGIFDPPQFDFHFYTPGEAERMSISPYKVDSVKFKKLPATARLPIVYFPTPGAIPQTGTHCIDLTFPETNGQLFRQTFIYGSFDGKVNFYQPGIKKIFLDSDATFKKAILTPTKFQTAGYCPTKMKVTEAAGGTHMTLENFMYRTQQGNQVCIFSFFE